MSTRMKTGVRSVLLLGSLVMLGCSPKEEVQPIEIETIERAEVTFDGQSCLYDGPEVIREGKVVIAIDNLSETPTNLQILKLDLGKTWQDMVDSIGEPGSYTGSRPAWSSLVRSSVLFDEPNAREYTFEPGMHAIICLQVLEDRIGIWPGAPLDVRAASSE